MVYLNSRAKSPHPDRRAPIGVGALIYEGMGRCPPRRAGLKGRFRVNISDVPFSSLKMEKHDGMQCSLA